MVLIRARPGDRCDNGEPIFQIDGSSHESLSVREVKCLFAASNSPSSVFTLERLTDEDMRSIISRAVERHSRTDEAAVSPALQQPASSQSSDTLPVTQESAESNNSLYPSYPQLTPRVIASLISLAAGDARTALSLLELVFASKSSTQEKEVLTSLRQSVSCSYDRTGESHYDMISALHKSVRGSQGDAAMYWLARMLTAGEDPLYIARRMVVCASEDIGLADNHALPLVSWFYRNDCTIAHDRLTIVRRSRLCMLVNKLGCRNVALTWPISSPISLKLQRVHVHTRLTIWLK